MPASAPISIARYFRDGFRNVVSRINAAGTKAQSDTYGYPTWMTLTPEELEAAYRTSWFGKICDIPPFDMTREWRNWQADEAQIELIEEEERRLDLRNKVRLAMTWARIYGGAGIVIGVDDGRQPSEPLNLDGVQQGALKFLHILSSRTLTAGDIDRDPMSETFYKPTYYSLANNLSGNIQIHPSRVVRFIGHEIPEQAQSGAGTGWGDSTWVYLERHVKNADLALGGIAELIHEAKVDVIKIPGLMEKMATEEWSNRLISRFQIANDAKSNTNALLLDSEEEWNQKTQAFAGLTDIARLYLSAMAGMADIPATRLLGKSPDGMNATGDSDLRNYYDMLKSRQNLELRPAISDLDEIIMRSAMGVRPPEIGYIWAPLYQMTQKEKADVDNITADVIKKIADTGLIPDTAMATVAQNKLIEDSVFPGLDQALADAALANELPPLLTQPTPAEIALAAANNPAPAPGSPPGSPGSPPGPVPANSNKPPPKGKTSLKAAADSAPRSLYVYRPVLNGAEIVAWAKKQGFETTVPAADMHVTVAFSRQPIDWMKVGADDWAMPADDGKLTIPPGGPRTIEPLGPKGALVLMFASNTLAWRWRRILDAGASWEYGEDYQPHITITYEETNLDWRLIVPYRGRIVLGPEIFEEVADDWAENPTDLTQAEELA